MSVDALHPTLGPRMEYIDLLIKVVELQFCFEEHFDDAFLSFTACVFQSLTPG